MAGYFPLLGGSMKSHVRDQLRVAISIYRDAIAKCADIEPNVRDLLTLRSRVKNEGLSFLTITLPAFGNDFDRSLSLGQIGTLHFRSFKKCKGIPAFLQDILCLVFDKRSGRLLFFFDILVI